VKVTFYGVRGSTPCPADRNRRYGGNTACVALEVPDEDPIVFDLGTGLRFFGDTQPLDGSFRGTALVSHIHWDHVQGLPFFPPADRVGARFDVYGPGQEGLSLAQAFDEFMRPPYFPVRA
jgi:phosphoribosyl 1,2-cyclic phosphodiesterase